MKSFIVFALFVAAAVAAPASPDSQAKVLGFENENEIDKYRFGYETENGIKQQEQGELTNVGTENEAIVVRGQFSYPGPDGVLYTVTYIADKDGYHPQGAHLPVPPQ